MLFSSALLGAGVVILIGRAVAVGVLPAELIIAKERQRTALGDLFRVVQGQRIALIFKFIACKKAVEAYTTSFAAAWLCESGLITDVNSQAACEAYIATGFSINSKNENDKIREAILQHIAANCQAGDEPLLATAKAIQFALYTYRYPSTTPSDFCNVLGVKAGLVGPSGNATKYKRLLINRFLLETIVLSVVDPEDLEDGIDLRRLGELLRDSYRIIIGTDTDIDYELLDSFGIAAGTPEDLRGELSENARAIANMLISMGLAKRYADGVTIIGWGL